MRLRSLPLTHKLTLGCPEKFTLSLQNKESLTVERIQSNVPDASMVIVAENQFLFRHDMARAEVLPSKSHTLIIPKDWIVQIECEYNGMVPRGYISNTRFEVCYWLIGEVA